MNATMTREQTEAEARLHEALAQQKEAEASQADARAERMVMTTKGSNGRFGHLANPMAYALHLKIAADKRVGAAELRVRAANLWAGVAS